MEDLQKISQSIVNKIKKKSKKSKKKEMIALPYIQEGIVHKKRKPKSKTLVRTDKQKLSLSKKYINLFQQGNISLTLDRKKNKMAEKACYSPQPSKQYNTTVNFIKQKQLAVLANVTRNRYLQKSKLQARKEQIKQDQQQAQQKISEIDPTRKAKMRLFQHKNEIEQLLKQTKMERFRKLQSINEDNLQPINKGIILRDQIRYENLKSLNQGEYASVYIARDVKTGRKVVVKTYYRYKIIDTKRKNFVNREISLLKKLQHVNIIRLSNTYTTKFGVHLVMDYMPFNLREFVKIKTLATAQIRNIFKQIVSSVDYCHKLNIIHRDIKLENVLVNQDQLIKLTDFGYSSYDCDLHQIYLGTFPYMAPEILNKLPYKGKPADIWALGVLLFYIIHKNYPFIGKNNREMVESMQNFKPPGGQFSVILTQCLNFNPQERANIGRLRELLK